MWLTETAWPPAILLIILAVGCGFIGFRRGGRSWFVAVILLALAIPIAFVIERSIVTPGEEIERLVYDLRDAVVAGDIEATLAFFSPQAVAERTAIRTGMSLGKVKPDVDVSDLQVKVTADSTATSHFRANGTFAYQTPVLSGERRISTRWRLSWRREAGQWKVYGIDRLNPITGEVISILSSD